ncbi:MAG: type II toxin-antitoxin system HicB family antitoxin [Dehalococcoidia bacterium]|jgi:predicted RNase H-like HicB family nuclease
MPVDVLLKNLLLSPGKTTNTRADENPMSEYLISINIQKLEGGGYLATSESIQGLIAQGRTIAETMEIAQDVARKLIESSIEHGDPLPVNLLPSTKMIKNVKIPISVTV